MQLVLWCVKFLLIVVSNKIFRLSFYFNITFCPLILLVKLSSLFVDMLLILCYFSLFLVDISDINVNFQTIRANGQQLLNIIGVTRPPVEKCIEAATVINLKDYIKDKISQGENNSLTSKLDIAVIHRRNLRQLKRAKRRLDGVEDETKSILDTIDPLIEDDFIENDMIGEENRDLVADEVATNQLEVHNCMQEFTPILASEPLIVSTEQAPSLQEERHDLEEQQEKKSLIEALSKQYESNLTITHTALINPDLKLSLASESSVEIPLQTKLALEAQISSEHTSSNASPGKDDKSTHSSLEVIAVEVISPIPDGHPITSTLPIALDVEASCENKYPVKAIQPESQISSDHVCSTSSRNSTCSSVEVIGIEEIPPMPVGDEPVKLLHSNFAPQEAILTTSSETPHTVSETREEIIYVEKHVHIEVEEIPIDDPSRFELQSNGLSSSKGCIFLDNATSIELSDNGIPFDLSSLVEQVLYYVFSI